MQSARRWYALAPRPWTAEPGMGGHRGLPEGALGAVDLAGAGAPSPVFAAFVAPPAEALAVFGDGADRLDRLVLSARDRAAFAALVPGVEIAAGASLLGALWSVLTDQADPDGAARARPIMPTHRGIAELHLGGRSPVHAERLPADPRRHRAWPRLQAALQRDYAGIERRCPAMARKWLGAQALKYRLPAEAARDLLIPAGLPRVMPAVPTTTFADDFGRPDGPVGADWVAKAGAWSLVGGQLVCAGGGANYERVLHWAADLSGDDHEVQADLISYAADTAFAGPAARVDPARATYYAAQVRGGTTRYSYTYRVENGVRAILAKGTGYGVPATSRLVCDGSTIQSYNDGVLAFSVTDTAITGHLRAGIAAHPAGSVAQVFDNFSASDLLPPPELAALPGALAVAGSPAAFAAARALGGPSGALMISGRAALLAPVVPLAGPPVGLALAGATARLSPARRLRLGSGELTLAGRPAAMMPRRAIIAAPGALTIAGAAVGIAPSRRLGLDAGKRTVAGRAALLGRAARLELPGGALAIAGRAARLTPPAPRISARPGLLALSGGPATLDPPRVLRAGPAALALSGHSARMDRPAGLGLPGGALVIGGGRAGIAASLAIAAAPGLLVLAGNPAGFAPAPPLAARPLTALPGALVLIGAGLGFSRPVPIGPPPGRIWRVPASAGRGWRVPASGARIYRVPASGARHFRVR